MLYLLILILCYGLAFVLALMINLDRAQSLTRYLAFMAGLLFLPFIIVALLTTVTASVGYDGNCYGFTDGQWGCSIWEFLVLQVDYAFLFTLFFNMLWFGLLVMMCIVNLVMRYMESRRA